MKGIKSIRAACFFILLSSISFSSECRVAIDIGHTPKKGGAKSARGISEYRFNELLGKDIRSLLSEEDGIETFIINEKQKEIKLKDRIKQADKFGADIILSIHHDSTKDRFLRKWKFRGKEERYCNRFSGFTLIISPKNQMFEESLSAATLIGEELLKIGRKPSIHHKMNIKGERKSYYSEEKGIMRYDNLIVLKKANSPAVLIEAGIIVNKKDEEQASNKKERHKFSKAVTKAIKQWCSEKF